MVVGQLHVFLAAQLGVVADRGFIQVAEGTLQDATGHVVLRRVERSQPLQFAKAGHDELRDVPVLGHFIEPREGPAGQLHALQLEQGPAGFAPQPRFIKQLGEAGQPLGFALRVAHPGRFLQQQILQFLVLGQLAAEGIFLGSGAALRLARPFGQDGFEAGIGAENPGRNEVGVEAAEYLLGALIRIVHEVGQALYGIPGGVGRHFQREGVVAAGGAAGARQLGKLKRAAAGPHDGQRQALGNEHSIWEHG